jgi:hypothetical protein
MGAVHLQAQTGVCALNGQEAFAILAQDVPMKTNSRWVPIYILIAVYVFWTFLYLLSLKLRSPKGKAFPSDAVDVEMTYNPLHSQQNPLHSNRSVDPGELPSTSPRDRLYNVEESPV